MKIAVRTVVSPVVGTAEEARVTGLLKECAVLWGAAAAIIPYLLPQTRLGLSKYSSRMQTRLSSPAFVEDKIRGKEIHPQWEASLCDSR